MQKFLLIIKYYILYMMRAENVYGLVYPVKFLHSCQMP